MSGTATAYRYGLDKSSKKFICPQCGKKRFVRMMDFELNEYMPDEVGRCDREGGCSYEMTVKQYFESKGIGYKPERKEIIIEPEVIDFMPLEVVQQSMKEFYKSNFAAWLTSLIGEKIADHTLTKYLVGRSKNDNNKACIFWRIDIDGNVRTGKIMCYDPATGKRNKEILPTWVHTQKNKNGENLFPGFRYKLPFFGENLLAEYPEKTVAVFESEKTALVASLFFPDFVCIATGGSSGCKWREYSVYKVLKDRKIIMFPDFGIYNVKDQKTCFQEWKDRANRIMEVMPCTITINRILEDRLTEDQRNGQDLADFLIKQQAGKGLALTDDNYPLIFDIYPGLFKHSVSDYQKTGE